MNRQEVNATLPTVDIKGKPYVTVDSRVEAFRQLYPNGAIITEVTSFGAGTCTVKATVLVDGEVVSTGHAFENQQASYINKTSFLENCETSAVGRALGFLGIGLNGSIASADEVSIAIEQQEKASAKKNRFLKIGELKIKAIESGISEDALRSWMQANVGADMKTFTDAQIKQVEDHIQQLIDDKDKLNG